MTVIYDTPGVPHDDRDYYDIYVPSVSVDKSVSISLKAVYFNWTKMPYFERSATSGYSIFNTAQGYATVANQTNQLLVYPSIDQMDAWGYGDFPQGVCTQPGQCIIKVGVFPAPIHRLFMTILRCSTTSSTSSVNPHLLTQGTSTPGQSDMSNVYETPLTFYFVTSCIDVVIDWS